MQRLPTDFKMLKRMVVCKWLLELVTHYLKIIAVLTLHACLHHDMSCVKRTMTKGHQIFSKFFSFFPFRVLSYSSLKNVCLINLFQFQNV